MTMKTLDRRVPRATLEGQCKQALILYNLGAPSKAERDLLLARIAHELCEQYGYFVTLFAVHPQKRISDLIPLLQSPLDRVIVLGGDGTARFALAALAQSGANIPVGIVPLGTANVLARNLGILDCGFFAKSTENALSVLKSGKAMSIDLGVMNGEYFAVTAAVGPFSDAFIRPKLREKKALGLFAYARTMLQTITQPPRLFRITMDGFTFETLASGVFVSNVEDLGLGRPPDINELTDGFLALNIFTPNKIKDYVEIGFRFAHGDIDASPPQYLRKVKEVLIEADTEGGTVGALRRGATSDLTAGAGVEPGLHSGLRAMIDGEEWGTTPMHVKVVPKAAQVLVPDGSGN
jgi:diacylglycerol kinase family enzyme